MIGRVVRFVFLAGVALAAAVALLGLAYLQITPVSTLMVGRWLTGRPVERIAVPLGAVSPHLIAAVIASEDARFCRHGGVDWTALREVLDDSDEGGPSRGASTIAMQTAKNLFLWPSRSYIRKGLEVPLALYIGAVWPKRRLIENYLNVAEWGEGIFGIEAAARHRFGRSARDLGRREAALLATSLPNPILRNPAAPTPRQRVLAAQLLARMDDDAPTCL